MAASFLQSFWVVIELIMIVWIGIRCAMIKYLFKKCDGISDRSAMVFQMAVR